MKLATTTADLGRYSDTLSGQVKLFEGTGFRLLDLNMYDCLFKSSPLLGDLWESLTDDAGESAASLDMAFCQAHAPAGNASHLSGEGFDSLINATIRSIEICAKLGIKNLVTHTLDIGGYPSRENRRQKQELNRLFFEKLFPVMDRTGVYILIENICDALSPTGKENIRHFSSTAAELLDILDYNPHPLLQVCWDIGHANIQGVDQYRSIRELGEHLKALHIADNYGDADSHVAPFQGTTNIDAVMQGLLDSGYQGYFTFESSNILRDGTAWPHYRHEWNYCGKKSTRLRDIPMSLKRESIKLLYEIGKHILTEYGCFEN